MLTTLAVVSFVLPALAAAPPELEVEPVEGFIQEERVEVEEAPAIRLDGEPMQSVEYEILNGVCYVTVSSFVSMLDPEAMVEEERTCRQFGDPSGHLAYMVKKQRDAGPG